MSYNPKISQVKTISSNDESMDVEMPLITDFKTNADRENAFKNIDVIKEAEQKEVKFKKKRLFAWT